MDFSYTETTQMDNLIIKSFDSASIFENVLEWLLTHRSIENVIDRRILIEWAAEQRIEDIFDERALIEWAEDNGYSKDDTKEM